MKLFLKTRRHHEYVAAFNSIFMTLFLNLFFLSICPKKIIHCRYATSKPTDSSQTFDSWMAENDTHLTPNFDFDDGCIFDRCAEFFSLIAAGADGYIRKWIPTYIFCRHVAIHF